MAKAVAHRSGHHQLGGGGRDGGRPRGGDPERRWWSHDAVGGGFTEDGQRRVGQVAKRQAILNPEASVYSAKRFIGRKWSGFELGEHRVLRSAQVVVSQRRQEGES